MTLTGKARVAGIVGWPITHSRSPQLHGFWLNHHGIDGIYVPLGVPPERIDIAFKGLAAAGFRGLNVTLPHKLTAYEACDKIDDTAKRIGAVNTIVFGDDGAIHGGNTDAFGFIENVRQNSDWASGGTAVVLGAGGSARAVCVALSDAGVTEIRLINRTRERAETLAESLGGPVTAGNWADRNDALDGAGLLVNTTSLGMTGQPPLEIDLAALPGNAVVNDIVYAPLETELLAAARARGNQTVDGIGMLLHQARPGFKAWFGQDPEVTPELREFVLGSV